MRPVSKTLRRHLTTRHGTVHLGALKFDSALTYKAPPLIQAKHQFLVGTMLLINNHVYKVAVYLATASWLLVSSIVTQQASKLAITCAGIACVTVNLSVGIVVPPEPVNVGLNKSANITCTAIADDIRWEVNGVPIAPDLRSRGFDDSSPLIPVNVTQNLHMRTMRVFGSAENNNTNITCIAVIITPFSIDENEVTLLVFKPGAFSSLQCVCVCACMCVLVCVFVCVCVSREGHPHRSCTLYLQLRPRSKCCQGVTVTLKHRSTTSKLMLTTVKIAPHLLFCIKLQSVTRPNPDLAITSIEEHNYHDNCLHAQQLSSTELSTCVCVCVCVCVCERKRDLSFYFLVLKVHNKSVT